MVRAHPGQKAGTNVFLRSLMRPTEVDILKIQLLEDSNLLHLHEMYMLLIRAKS
jgi:hypothetical protein